MDEKTLGSMDKTHLTINDCGIDSARYLSEKFRKATVPKGDAWSVIWYAIRSPEFLKWIVSYILFAFVSLIFAVMWRTGTNLFSEFIRSSEILFTNVTLVFSLLLERSTSVSSRSIKRDDAVSFFSVSYVFLGMCIYAVECANRAVDEKGVQYLPENQLFGDFTVINLLFFIGALLVVIFSKVDDLMSGDNTEEYRSI